MEAEGEGGRADSDGAVHGLGHSDLPHGLVVILHDLDANLLGLFEDLEELDDQAIPLHLEDLVA